MKNLLQRLVNLVSRTPTRSTEEETLARAVDAQDLQVRPPALERGGTEPHGLRPRAAGFRRPAAYIGRKRCPNARLTFSGLCRPRTARL